MMAMCPRNKWPVLANSICLDVFVNSYGLHSYQTMCRHKWKAFCVYNDWKRSGKQQAECERVKTSVCTWATIKEAHSQDYNSLDNLYIRRTSLTICFFFVHGDSSPLFQCGAMRLPSEFCFQDPFWSAYTQNAFRYRCFHDWGVMEFW